MTIAEVLALFEGEETPNDLDTPILLEDVYVGYVRTVGYTVQQEQEGPGLFVFTNGAHGLSAGNKIDLLIHSLGAFNGLPQADQVEVVANDNGSYDVLANLAQDLGAGEGTAPGAEHVAELLKVTGATVVSGANRSWVIQYGSTAVEAKLYAYEAVSAGLCVGATLNIANAYGSVNNGAYEIAAYNASDFTNVDTSACETIEYDDSNWDFEDWTTSNPPPGFVKETQAFTVTQETTQVEPDVGGSSSAKLTWTSPDNQDLLAGYARPVAPGQTATCTWRYYDNDPAGRFRVITRFVDASGNQVNQLYSDDYSVDGATWQVHTASNVAPEGAAGFRCGVRLYDVANSWNGTATLYVDNLSATVTD